MHICCAPDATVGIERLKRFGELLGWFYNPNIEPIYEYRIRETEVRRLTTLEEIEYTEEPPDRIGWKLAVAGFEAEPERGERCRRCISFNLEQAAKRAVDLGIRAFATTLTASPHKDVPTIHRLGAEIAGRYRIGYIAETLRRDGGLARRRELTDRWGIYRQKYCGCRWSLADYYRRQGIAPEESEPWVE